MDRTIRQGGSWTPVVFTQELSDRAAWVEVAARAGYTAKGVVYAVVGILAVKPALGAGGDPEGGRGVLRIIGEGPFGRVLLALLALGLVGYVVWRLVQGVLDPEGEARRQGAVKGLFVRGGHLASAATHGGLAFLAVRTLLGMGPGSGSATRAHLTTVMTEPGGRWLVGGAGLALVGWGLLQIVQALRNRLATRIRSFHLRPIRERRARRIARFGISARGAAFGFMGGYLLLAAIRYDPSRARALDAVLESLSDHPRVLATLGLGLVGYAAFQWMKARYRLIKL